MNTPEDEEFTELRDAAINRVDLVDKAANGTKFLIAKRENGAGLMDADFVRDLIGKTAAAPATEDTVTMTGSPGALMRLIHEASLRRDDVAKEKYDTADRKDMGASGAAMPDGSYPIEDRADLTRAIRAVGRGGADHDAIRRHVIQRAASLGASSEIPDNWNKDGSLKGDVAKEMDMDDDALDAGTALAVPDGDYAGMATDPGSPAWEAVDAATAQKWLAILARAQNAIDMLAEREMLEAASADPDDAENAWDLQDACCAIDYAISVLAPFAVSEQAEADCCDDMQMVGKALHAFDPAGLATIEALAPVVKAGRVLSATNEKAIRDAADSLQKVLASLPAAPAAEDVTKTANEEPDMDKPTLAEDVADEHGQAPAMGVQQADPKPVAGQPVTDMTKADGEKPEMMAVFDANGDLYGIVDPSKVTRVSGTKPAPSDVDDSDADSSDESDDDTETTDLTPEPPAEAGTPADAAPTEDDNAVTKSTNHTNTDLSEMFKSSLQAAVDDVVAKQSAAQAEEIAQLRDAVLELAELTKAQADRIGVLEEQPAMPKVLSNGVQPPRDLRGMDRGTAAVDVTKAQELKKALMASTDATEQRDIAKQMQERMRVAFDQLQQRG